MPRILLAFALLLAACRGMDTTLRAGPVVPARRYVELRINPTDYTKDNALRVLFLGDSITQGGGDDQALAYGGYRGFLQQLFPRYGLEHFEIVGAFDDPDYGPPPPYSARNSGIGGASWSPEFTYPLGSIVDAWNLSKDLHPHLVFVMGGGNGLTLGETTAHNVAAGLALLRQIFADSPGVCVVLGSYITQDPSVSLFPGITFNQQVTDMNNALKRDAYEVLRREGHRIFWADINAAFAKATARGRAVLGPSGSHPSRLGYQIMADTWLRDSNVFK